MEIVSFPIYKWIQVVIVQSYVSVPDGISIYFAKTCFHQHRPRTAIRPGITGDQNQGSFNKSQLLGVNYKEIPGI